jgi:hypothetical protein
MKKIANLFIIREYFIFSMIFSILMNLFIYLLFQTSCLLLQVLFFINLIKKKKNPKIFLTFCCCTLSKTGFKNWIFYLLVFLLSKTGYFYQPHNPDARTG